ncbi:MAG: ACT domain-containing protein, partial [Pseudomonadales bacterium]|nr:ACT domain-containing protein [Pseudomonadales bacterium]
MITANLLISCADKSGLVAAISQLLHACGANIVEMHQHTDQDKQLFFQRIQFDISALNVSRARLEENLGEECSHHGMTWEIFYSDVKKRIAIFSSRYDHCLFDLLLRHRIGELDCEIPLVISNHEEQRSVVENFDIPFFHFPITKLNKMEQEACL